MDLTVKLIKETGRVEQWSFECRYKKNYNDNI
jgi:hypothetical protein